MPKSILFVCLLSLAFPLIGQDSSKVTPEVRIGFLMDDISIDRWKMDSLHFCRAVKRLGGEPMVRVASGDPHLQQNQARELIERGCKVLVVIPSESKSASSIVNFGHRKGVKVVAYDRLIMYCIPDYYISFDNVKVGELQAQYALDHTTGGTFLIIGGPTSDQNSLMVEQGQIIALKDHLSTGEVHLSDKMHLKSWSAQDSHEYLEGYLATHSDKISAIIAANDAIAEGVIEVLKDRHLEGKILVTGQDGERQALERIKSGSQAMTVYKPVDKLAVRAAHLAYTLATEDRPHENRIEYIDNGDTRVPFVRISPMVVDVSNVDSVTRH